jgi:DNA-binding XRE family transcriptional regulator
MTEGEMRQLIRDYLASRNMRACEWAKELDVSPQYLSMVMRGHKRPNDKICEAICVRKVVRYEIV